jgi:hypothetical protein
MACERDQRVGEYMAGLPDWQQAIGRQLRDLIHAVDPEIAETIQTHGAMSGPTHAHRCARFTGETSFPRRTLLRGSELAAGASLLSPSKLASAKEEEAAGNRPLPPNSEARRAVRNGQAPLQCANSARGLRHA